MNKSISYFTKQLISIQNFFKRGKNYKKRLSIIILNLGYNLNIHLFICLFKCIHSYAYGYKLVYACGYKLVLFIVGSMKANNRTKVKLEPYNPLEIKINLAIY